MSFLSTFFSSSQVGLVEDTPRTVTTQDNSLAIVHRLRELESQALIEDEEKKSYEKIRMKFEMDTYSLLFLRLVQWWDGDASMIFWTRHGEFKGKFRRVPVVAFVHAVILFVMAAGLQVIITYLLFENSRANMHPWSNFLSDSGISLHEAAKVLGQAVAMDQADLSVPVSYLGSHLLANSTEIVTHIQDACHATRKVQHYACYAFVMLLWIAKILPEFRQSKAVFRTIWSMEVRKDGNMPLLEADGVTILRLDWWLQAVLLLIIPCVRFFVAVLVAWAGIDFLLAQQTTGNIVLKALCMQFVTDIDNLFLVAFTSAGGRDLLSNMRVFVNPEKLPFWTTAPDLWDNGVGGLVYILIALLTVIFTTGAVGRFAELGDFKVVKYNLMFFRYKCQAFCDAFPASCPLEEFGRA